MPSPPKLILCLFCLCAAAQEPSNAPTAHEQQRKAYDEIYSTKRGMFSVEPNAYGADDHWPQAGTRSGRSDGTTSTAWERQTSDESSSAEAVFKMTGSERE